jgi:hypothetical protein
VTPEAEEEMDVGAGTAGAQQPPTQDVCGRAPGRRTANNERPRCVILRALDVWEVREMGTRSRHRIARCTRVAKPDARTDRLLAGAQRHLEEEEEEVRGRGPGSGPGTEGRGGGGVAGR